jgi:microcystin-dependent protein
MTSPIDTNEPTIVLNEDVVESGVFPNDDSGGDPGGLPVGTIRIFAGDTPSTENGIAGNEQPAQGQSLSVTQQEKLFSLLGTFFGGNGIQTFDLPNLAGTVMAGTGNGPDGNLVLGEKYGQDSVTLSEANMPRPVGAGDPYNNDQPSLGVNYLINIGGSFEGTGVDALGMVVPFVGDFALSGYVLAAGQILQISQNTALYDVLGNTYGGNASQGTFALPNLVGRAVIGADNGNPSSTEPLGTASGSNTTTLTSANLPPPSGFYQSVDNQQPTLALNYIIDVDAPNSAFFPTSGALGANTPYFGEIMAYAGLTSTIPTGWVVAAGQTLSVAANIDLFLSIGVTYGGNGTTTFDLPNLEDKVVAGTGSNSGQTYTLGETYGANSYNLTTAELPPNQAPSVTLGSAIYSTPEQQSLDLSNTGISVADPDGGNGQETLTITASEGTLQDTLGGAVTVTSGNDTSNLVLSGTIFELDGLLGGHASGDLTFIDNTNTPTTVTLTFSLDDNGYTGSGGPQTSPTETATIDVVPCYCPGTLIETACGEKRIETLKIGDRVQTKSGTTRPIKWIGRRSYGGRFIMGRKDILPICLKAGSLADHVPKRNLWISPHHAMYLEGVLIEAKDLVNGVSIVQAEQAEKIEYFHIELDSHDVIIAEGSLSESFIDDDSRGMFHNAHEYRETYGDAPAAPARYCASRLDSGYEVEAARAKIEQRAGLRTVAADRKLALRGRIDVVQRHVISGWAQNPDYPEAAVCLDIYAGGQLIGQTLANRFRADLEHAGLGSGRHSFDFTPPRGLDLATVEVRRSLDGAVLKGARDTVELLALRA